MLPVWAIMAMAGAAKGAMDKQQEKRDRHAAAVAQQYQPWTGMQAGPISHGDIAGSAMQGGLAGYGVDQSNSQNDQFQQYMKALAAGQNGQTSPNPNGPKIA